MTQLGLDPAFNGISAPSPELKKSVSSFSAYNAALHELWHDLNTSIPRITLKTSSVNREATSHLRRLIPIGDLRKAGTFFTGDNLADEAASLFSRPITSNSVVLDPACGAGNLLLACSKKLPVTSCLYETVEIWGHVLCGWDIFPEFVEATKVRIILEGIDRGCIPNGASLSTLKTLLYKIKPANAIAEFDGYSSVSHLVINPPYNRIQAPKKCSWGGGKINAAALFFEHALNNIPKAADMVAILPEVLRSGSRYQKWRAMLEKNLPNASYTIKGRFDKNTDVDVFILAARRCANPEIAPIPALKDQTVSDFFKVCVGPVVPFRDPHDGEGHPYIFPRMLPVWKEVTEIEHRRQFAGKVFAPPLVAIRRTSSPQDRNRAGATLIAGEVPVAIENHLIVALPKSGSLEDCRRLLKLLQSDFTTEYLNKRIRCRHLTVGSILEIPWIEDI